MRVISVIGHSNSGKTTLITRIIPLLSAAGKTAAVKHLGDHIIDLPPGKDTTKHFTAGAGISAGIDAGKTVMTMDGTDLYTVLDIYAYLGYAYCVIEGFKEEGFPCAVMGDLPCSHALCRNPTAEDLFALRDTFPEYIPHHV